MAKQCALCGKEAAQVSPLAFELRNTMICPECRAAITKIRNNDFANGQDGELAAYALANWSAISDPAAAKYIENATTKLSAVKEKAHEIMKNRADAAALKESMIVTSSGTVEGYHITRYAGLVFGETFYKASFGASLSRSFEDFSNAFALTSTEMTGVVAHLEQAREFAIDKMMAAAAEKGCNAVIAVDAESSIAGEITHISIFGTAVYIEKD